MSLMLLVFLSYYYCYYSVMWIYTVFHKGLASIKNILVYSVVRKGKKEEKN